jgi:hypothetical protein
VTRALLSEVAHDVFRASSLERLVSLPDSDDPSLRDAEADPETYFFGWRANDAAAAFGSDDVLERPLRVALRLPGWGELASAFALHGLWVRDDRDAASAVVDPREAVTRSSDLIAIVAALRALRRERFVAEPSFGCTMTDGFGELIPHARTTRRKGVVFWHGQDHETAFDADGMLIDTLRLRWAGDLDAMCTTLERELAGAGLGVHKPPNETEAISIERIPLLH